MRSCRTLQHFNAFAHRCRGSLICEPRISSGSIFGVDLEAIERGLFDGVGPDRAAQPEGELHAVDVAIVGEIEAVLDRRRHPRRGRGRRSRSPAGGAPRSPAGAGPRSPAGIGPPIRPRPAGALGVPIPSRRLQHDRAPGPQPRLCDSERRRRDERPARVPWRVVASRDTRTARLQRLLPGLRRRRHPPRHRAPALPAQRSPAA